MRLARELGSSHLALGVDLGGMVELISVGLVTRVDGSGFDEVCEETLLGTERVEGWHWYGGGDTEDV